MIAIFKEFGNHPSLISIGVGNEVRGDVDLCNNTLIDCREIDNTRLYNADMNMYLMDDNNKPQYTKCQTPLHFADFFVTRHTKNEPLRIHGMGRFVNNTDNVSTNFDLMQMVYFLDKPY